jgi:hypothetical protein
MNMFGGLGKTINNVAQTLNNVTKQADSAARNTFDHVSTVANTELKTVVEAVTPHLNNNSSGGIPVKQASAIGSSSPRVSV